jgi:hypothetical protein
MALSVEITLTLKPFEQYFANDGCRRASRAHDLLQENNPLCHKPLSEGPGIVE